MREIDEFNRWYLTCAILTKWNVNVEDMFQTQDLYFDTMLNHCWLQKFKLIEEYEFNHLIYIII